MLNPIAKNAFQTRLLLFCPRVGFVPFGMAAFSLGFSYAAGEYDLPRDQPMHFYTAPVVRNVEASKL